MVEQLKEIAAKAVELLPFSFAWSDTPQGRNYWVQVYADLRVLAESESDNLFAASEAAETWGRGAAPFADEHHRKQALQLADLIGALLLYFIAPPADDSAEDQFPRWSTVLDNLFELAGENRDSIPDELDRELDP